jgi:hypothetical protein
MIRTRGYYFCVAKKRVSVSKVQPDQINAAVLVVVGGDHLVRNLLGLNWGRTSRRASTTV